MCFSYLIPFDVGLLLNKVNSCRREHATVGKVEQISEGEFLKKLVNDNPSLYFVSRTYISAKVFLLAEDLVVHVKLGVQTCDETLVGSLVCSSTHHSAAIKINT